MSMRRCPSCQRRFPEDLNFCPKDGAPLRPAPVDDDPLLGQTLLGQFELCERLGSGSMGTVYKAWQETMERHVAVKVMRPEMVGEPQILRRFKREARAAARLSHPNIITVHLVGETKDDRPFIVMELVDGESLEAVLKREGSLAPIRALHLTRQIAAALSEAHAHDVIHRDLKPANIHLVCRRTAVDQVKVLDFGIAKIMQEAEESQITQTGAIFGTPYYLSPEQASGAKVDHRSDIYSLGVMLFRLLTGRVPFDAANGMEVLIKHLKESPPRPRHFVRTIPAPLEELVLEMLAKDVSARPQSAEALLQRIDAIMAALYPGAPPPPGSPGLASDPPQSTRPASQPFITLSQADAPWDALEHDEDRPPGIETLLEARELSHRRLRKHLLLALLALLLGGGLGFGAHALKRREPAKSPPKPAAPDVLSPPRDAAAAAAALPPPRVDSGAKPDTTAATPPPPTARVKKPSPAKESKKKKKKRRKKRRRPEPRRPQIPTPKAADAGSKTEPPTAPIAPLPVPEPAPKPAPPEEDDDHGSAVPAPSGTTKPPYELLN